MFAPKKSIGAVIDINDRYGFNNDPEYRSDSSELQALLRSMSNIINNKVSSLSCGPVEIYDRSRYQQWRYDCDPEAIEKKMGKQR